LPRGRRSRSKPAARAEWCVVMLRTLLTIQGVYYIVSGLWPFAHPDSFVKVVGPKPDRFQLLVTSALIVAIGAVVLSDSRKAGAGTIRLSVAAAAALLFMEAAYARSLRRVFALDAAVEMGLIAGVLCAAPPRPHPAP
jgi:uncharacterized membrane protein